MTASTDLVFTLGKMDANTRVTGTMVNNMVMASTDKQVDKSVAAAGKKANASHG